MPNLIIIFFLITFLHPQTFFGQDLSIEGGTEILNAVKKGKISDGELLRIIQQKNANLRIKDESDRTALFWSARKGYESTVDTLCQQGANPNIMDINGNTALMVALQKEFLSIAITLLKICQANPNLADHNGITPLMYLKNLPTGTFKSTLLPLMGEESEELISTSPTPPETSPDSPVIIDEKDSPRKLSPILPETSPDSPIIEDIKTSSKTTFESKVVRKKGKQKKIQKNIVKDFIVLLHRKNDKKASAKVDFLEEVNHKILDLATDETMSVLIYSIRYLLKKTAIKLILRGADLNEKNKDGLPPLELAKTLDSDFYRELVAAIPKKSIEPDKSVVPVGSVEPVSETSPEILSKSVSPQPSNDSPSSLEGEEQVFIQSIKDKDDQKAKFLVDRIKNPDLEIEMPGADAKTMALILAIQNGMDKTAIALIKNGASINIKDSNEVTPLLAALENNMRDVAILLITNKADVRVRTKEGVGTLEIAVRNKDSELADLLIKNGADARWFASNGEPHLLNATINKDLPTIIVIMKGGAFPINIGESGVSPIEYALSHNFREIYETFIKTLNPKADYCDYQYQKLGQHYDEKYRGVANFQSGNLLEKSDEFKSLDQVSWSKTLKANYKKGFKYSLRQVLIGAATGLVSGPMAVHYSLKRKQYWKIFHILKNAIEDQPIEGIQEMADKSNKTVQHFKEWLIVGNVTKSFCGWDNRALQVFNISEIIDWITNKN